MENMTIHDWNKCYDNIDYCLAEKYQTTKYTIRYIRVSSIRKNLSQKEICFELIKWLNKYGENKKHSKQYENILSFVVGLSYEAWMDITRPNGAAIEYMSKNYQFSENPG